jgi:hypothetical protein
MVAALPVTVLRPPRLVLMRPGSVFRGARSGVDRSSNRTRTARYAKSRTNKRRHQAAQLRPNREFELDVFRIVNTWLHRHPLAASSIVSSAFNIAAARAPAAAARMAPCMRVVRSPAA